MDTFLKKNINISSVQETSSQIKLKDENGKTYSFFKKKKDGSPTQAFEQFAHYKVGDRTGISYKEVPFIANDGTNLKLNNLTNFMPIMQQSASPMPSQTPKSAPSEEIIPLPEEQPNNEAFWGKIGYKKCLWNYWVEKYASKAFEAKMSDSTLGQAEMDLVWQVFNQIEQDANKRFNQ